MPLYDAAPLFPQIVTAQPANDGVHVGTNPEKEIFLPDGFAPDGEYLVSSTSDPVILWRSPQIPVLSKISRSSLESSPFRRTRVLPYIESN